MILYRFPSKGSLIFHIENLRIHGSRKSRYRSSTDLVTVGFKFTGYKQGASQMNGASGWSKICCNPWQIQSGSNRTAEKGWSPPTPSKISGSINMDVWIIWLGAISMGLLCTI